MNVFGVPKRAWTEAEYQVVLEKYGKRPVTEIAREIDRSVLAVQQMAAKIGAVQKRDRDKAAKNRELIPKLHAQGYTDSDIAQVIGWTRRYVSKVRDSLGLGSNRGSDRYLAKVRAKTREQCDRAGYGSLAELRRAAHERWIVSRGWPSHLSLRSAQITELLWVHGPLTRKQLATLCGVRWLGSKKTFKTKRPGGSYLAELQRAGLVVQLKKSVPRDDGFAESLYMLAMGVEPCQESRSHHIPEA